MSQDKALRKKSSVRHTRAIQTSRSKHPLTRPTDEQVKERIQELVYPAALAQVAQFHALGLRERTLGLVVMVAFVLEMMWRQVSGVSELARLVQTEALLWEQPKQVSQQALSSRLTRLPADLFRRVLLGVLPEMRQGWAQRPLPDELAWATERYTAVQAVDGSTLDALVRKIGLLQDLPQHPLAGRITAVLNLGTRLPDQVWYEPDAQAHDQRAWPMIRSVLSAGSLLVFDLGYLNFDVLLQLGQAHITFLTRAKSNLASTLDRALVRTAAVHDSRVWIGQGETRQVVRLIEVLYRGKWYRYLTNELDPDRLPTAYVVALYWQRWRIEDAYAVVKRLWGLAYFWCGAQHAVELQVWATWLLYVVLVDLTDAVAEALHRPFKEISMEMVYRTTFLPRPASAARLTMSSPFWPTIPSCWGL